MDERDLFRGLAAAIRAWQVSVVLDYPRLGHTDSPIAVQADSNRWIYGIMALIAAAWYWGDWWYAGVALAAGLGLIGRRWIDRRMRRRFFERGLADLAVFKALWRLRGVTLVAGAARCASPDGDWRRFVMDHLGPLARDGGQGEPFAAASAPDHGA